MRCATESSTGVSEKQNALKWAEESLARYAAAAGAGTGADAVSQAHAAELMKALERLGAERPAGRRAGRPAATSPERQDCRPMPRRCVSSWRRFPSTSPKLKDAFGALARLGKEFGRFDPSEFPLDSSQSSPDGDGMPGSGGINRGRADAALTWGKESLPFDRFKAEPLPPGAARSPDDWAPVVELPGAPGEAPDGECARGRPAVRCRRRPERLAPHARATPPERREEVLREMSRP